MSISYWMHRPAVRRTVGTLSALLIAGVVGFWASLFWPDKPPPHEEQMPGTEAEYLARNLGADCLALIATPPAPDPTPNQTDDCKDKEKAQRYNYASLAQSIRSANAALYAAYIAYLQTCIGIAGAILVTATLIASGLATWAARNAAIGTIDAAQATRDSVNLTRRQMALIHRPKLRVRNVVMWPTAEGDFIAIEAEIANVGDNSGTATHIQCRLEQRSPSGHVLMHGGAVSELTDNEGQTRPVIYPVRAGASIVVKLQTNLRWDSNLFAQASAWVIVGTVMYDDAYVGDVYDFKAMEAFRSTERRTSFERFFRRRTTSGFWRFSRASEPDPEREYED